MVRYEKGETVDRDLLTRSGVSVHSGQGTAYTTYWKWKIYPLKKKYYYIYYPLKHLFDGNVNSFYASSAKNTKVSIAFPRSLYIHHLEIYPVSQYIKGKFLKLVCI